MQRLSIRVAGLLPCKCQLAHIGSAVTIVTSERTATCDILLVRNILDIERRPDVILLIVDCSIGEGHAIKIKRIPCIAKTLAKITHAATDAKSFKHGTFLEGVIKPQAGCMFWHVRQTIPSSLPLTISAFI